MGSWVRGCVGALIRSFVSFLFLGAYVSGGGRRGGGSGGGGAPLLISRCAGWRGWRGWSE